MGWDNLLVETAGRIVTVTVNRPRALNALDRATVGELRAVLGSVAAGDEAGVVIITGAGDRAFVAGADIAEFKDLAPPDALGFALAGQELLELVERMPQAVIAAVNGYALGGGCELAMACDIVIASENARFGQPEVGLGIIPGFGGTQRLPRLVGRHVAKELVLTGDMIGARRAWEIGLVNRVVPQAELMAAARETAEKILARAPFAVRTAKWAINRGLDMDLSNACALEAALFAAGFATADRAEGVAAFLEKRKPRFVGR